MLFRHPRGHQFESDRSYQILVLNQSLRDFLLSDFIFSKVIAGLASADRIDGCKQLLNFGCQVVRVISLYFYPGKIFHVSSVCDYFLPKLIQWIAMWAWLRLLKYLNISAWQKSSWVQRNGRILSVIWLHIPSRATWSKGHTKIALGSRRAREKRWCQGDFLLPQWQNAALFADLICQKPTG